MTDSVIHKRNAGGGTVCGASDSLPSSLYWFSTTCPSCLDREPPDSGGRASIKRSHRGEGDNFPGD